MKYRPIKLHRYVAVWVACLVGFTMDVVAASNTIELTRPRVVVSTDIGGTDPDDFQSMVHFLVYADRFQVEGLVSSPYGPGRKQHILDVVDHYERDYPNLKTYSPQYPTPQALRSITKEGALDGAGDAGFGQSTEGSQWIVECARRDEARPLWVLVWGGIDDLAQALHDAPEIESRLRVYFIGGPNKKWSVNAYHYIERHHPRLWIIEANATYRGWFVGGNQQGEWGNREFVSRHVARHGALGDFFATQLGGTIKMGDTPAVVYPLHPTPEDPSKPGWGGRFVRAWERPRVGFNRHTTAADRVEQFGVLELVLPLPAGVHGAENTKLVIENQEIAGHLDESGGLRFRFSPKDAKTWSYVLRSAVPALEGQSGAFTSYRPPAERAQQPSSRHPNWWTDDPSPDESEGPHVGAKTVSRWREAFLRDFAERMDRCTVPLAAKPEARASR
jgi:hypothetical protein